MTGPGGQRARPAGSEFVGEVSDLAAGVRMLVFTLAPFALPFLALTALVAVPLLVPALVGAMLVSPLVAARRWWRSRDRSSRASDRTTTGDREAKTPPHPAHRTPATPVAS